MHKYMRAIGLSQFQTKEQIKALIRKIMAAPDERALVGTGDSAYGYYGKKFCDGVGLRVYAEANQSGKWEWDYYFPYVECEKVSSSCSCSAERKSEKHAYDGLCEDPQLDVSLIYYINNGMELAKRTEPGKEPVRAKGVSLTGLSVKGKVLLPVSKAVLSKAIPQQRGLFRLPQTQADLDAFASAGEEEAMETLAIDEIERYRRVSERATREDLYSVIDTCFMPYGLECDQYTVVGEILSLESPVNSLTGEKLWRMELDCNNVKLQLVMNQQDLMGTPTVGRRFKGDIWLQGRAIF